MMDSLFLQHLENAGVWFCQTQYGRLRNQAYKVDRGDDLKILLFYLDINMLEYTHSASILKYLHHKD